jgi:hypothetical protein
MKPKSSENSKGSRHCLKRSVRPRPDKLEELRDKIQSERRFADKQPYSHNLISLTLSQIAHEFGKDEANAAVRDFKLKKLGWSIVV